MFCKQCGAEIGEDAKFCEQCGGPIGVIEAPPRGRPARRSRRRLVIGAAVFVLVVGIGAAGLVLFRRGAGDNSEPPARARLGDVWISPKDGAQMVYVPAGEFIMGSTPADIAPLVREVPWINPESLSIEDERPQFRTHLPGYWIDKYEVTVSQYRKFCQKTGRKMPPAPQWRWQDDHPIVNVTWDEAAAYAQWAGKRLPTEMEWEKAARGTDGRQYPWGNAWDADKCANWKNSPDGTQAVGRFPAGASPCGALDMAGNVSEWCADWYDQDAYKRYAKGDLSAPKTGKYLQVYRGDRGGSWYSSFPWDFRCAHREGARPVARGSIGGFRCARDASP